jgi:hypothetical protein
VEVALRSAVVSRETNYVVQIHDSIHLHISLAICTTPFTFPRSTFRTLSEFGNPGTNTFSRMTIGGGTSACMAASTPAMSPTASSIGRAVG